MIRGAGRVNFRRENETKAGKFQKQGHMRPQKARLMKRKELKSESDRQMDRACQSLATSSKPRGSWKWPQKYRLKWYGRPKTIWNLLKNQRKLECWKIKEDNRYRPSRNWGKKNRVKSGGNKETGEAEWKEKPGRMPIDSKINIDSDNNIDRWQEHWQEHRQ